MITETFEQVIERVLGFKITETPKDGFIDNPVRICSTVQIEDVWASKFEEKLTDLRERYMKRVKWFLMTSRRIVNAPPIALGAGAICLYGTMEGIPTRLVATYDIEAMTHIIGLSCYMEEL